jgi:NitT/TauT family transport system ATP-binding protein
MGSIHAGGQALRVAALMAGYGDTSVFRDVSFSVCPGETVAVVGPSGCGKSTLLLAVAGLHPYSAGAVTLGKETVVGGDRRVGLIFQQYGLFPWFTVEENVALGLRLHAVPKAEREARVADELSRVGLLEYRRRLPSALSSGQQQRVAIARSFALNPRVLLMDEPFSALDALARESLQDLLLTLLASRTVATVLVTHSIEEAVFLASRVYVMSDASDSGFAARVEAPQAASPDVRRDPRYFAACSEVRGCLEALHER